MFPTVGTAWRLVVRRATGDWPVLLAAFVTVLLSTTLLAAGPLYADATATAGLRQALADAPVPDANITVTARAPAAAYAALDQAVGQAAAAVLHPTGGAVLRTAESRSFALPGDEVELTTLAYLEGVEERSRLVTGAWPRGGGAPVEAALSTAAAAELGLAAGDVVELRSRERDAAVIPVRVSGTYAPLDPSAPAWFADPLVLEGVERSGTVPVYGPFVVGFETVQDVSPGPFELGWRLFPDFDRLAAGETVALRRAVERLGDGLPGDQRFSVGTRLPELLRSAELSLLVTRSGVLIPTLQLAVLAVYALLFIASLLLGQRRTQIALLAARGATARLACTAALVEGALLAVPAVAAGPWLAGGAIHLLGRVGPLAALGLRLDPAVSVEAYLVAAAAAAVAVLTLALPSAGLRAAGPQPSARGRAPRRGLVQRAGIDVLLLAAALLAYLQLRRYGTPVVAGLRGTLGIDPLLIAAPALVLLAGAVLGLRLVPLAARGAERLGARGLGAVAPLGTRELARRPLRHARAALLLTLALAIGLFALSYGETWLGSQQDQADYDVGADLRVLPDRRATALSPLALRDALGGIAGVEAVTPVLRISAPVAPVRGAVDVIALDAARADVLAFRPDLAARPIGQLLEPLARERRPSWIPLPPGTVRLEMTASLTVPGGDLTPSVRAIVRDGAGLPHEVRLGDLPADGAPHLLVADLATQGRSLEQLRLVTPIPEEPLAGTFAALRLQAVDGEGVAVPVRLGPAEDWESGRAVTGVTADPRPSVGPPTLGRDPLLALPFSTGAVPFWEDGLVTFAVPARDPAAAPLPALATEAFLAATGAQVGDEVTARLAGDLRTFTLTGVVRAFPTLDPAAPGLLVDLSTLATLEADSGAAVPEPGEWWVGVADGRAEAAAAALRAPPLSSREVLDRQERARAQSTNPVALGVLGILLLGFVAAAGFAVIGVAVSTVSSVRERVAEFCVVRALGLPPGQVRSWLVLESGLVLVASLVGGTALGLLLARLVLPSVTLTPEGAQVAPPVVVDVPVGPAVVLGLVLAAALVGVVAVQVALLRRVALAAVLRSGEER